MVFCSQKTRNFFFGKIANLLGCFWLNIFRIIARNRQNLRNRLKALAMNLARAKFAQRRAMFRRTIARISSKIICRKFSFSAQIRHKFVARNFGNNRGSRNTRNQQIGFFQSGNVFFERSFFEKIDRAVDDNFGEFYISSATFRLNFLDRAPSRQPQSLAKPDFV